MTCRLSPTDVSNLAQDFLEATTRKVGTDEATVYQVVQTVHNTGCQRELDDVVYFGTDIDTATQWDIEVKPARLNQSITSWILEDELSGTELAKAQDLLHLGHDTHRKSGFLYFADGLLDVFDFSNTNAKISMGIGLAATCAIGALAFIMLPVSAVVAAGLAVSITAGVGMVVSGAGILKNGGEIAWEYGHDDPTYKDDLHDLGTATSGFMVSVIGYKGTEIIDGGKQLFPIPEMAAGMRRRPPVAEVAPTPAPATAPQPPVAAVEPPPPPPPPPVAAEVAPPPPAAPSPMATQTHPVVVRRRAVPSAHHALKAIGILKQFHQLPGNQSGVYSVYWRASTGMRYYFHVDTLTGKMYRISGFDAPPPETMMEIVGILDPHSRIQTTWPMSTRIIAGELSPEAAAQIRGQH